MRLDKWDDQPTLVQLRARRPSSNGSPLVFPDLRARRPWWRSRALWLALGYPFCTALGAVVAIGTRW